MTELATDLNTGLDDSGLDDSGLDELAEVAGAVARDAGAGWARWAELGWFSLLVPEARDGAGADERAVAVVARELGRACRREPFVAAGVLSTSLLAGLPGAETTDELLAEVSAGERLAMLAWQPEDGGFDFAEHDSCELPLHVRFDGDRLILDGVACWIPTADAATYLLAAHGGRDLDDLTLIRVDADTPGLTVHHVEVADGTTYARLELAGVDVTQGAVLACGGEARAALGRGVDTAALITAAELLGLIDRMLELTLEYLASRNQFGRPIGTFQVLRHRAVDMWVQQRLAEAALEGALRRITAAPDDAIMRAKAASSAKSRASSAALKVAGEAVQLHGAIGFTDEYELGGYVNRSMVLAAWLGNSRAHTRRFGRLVSS